MNSTLPTVTGTERKVCEDIARRQSLGIQKYGQTVRDNPLALRAWLNHAYEECLDQAIYLKRAIEKIDADRPEVGAPFDEALNDDLDRLT